ncbi:hypothetical protein ACTJJ7_20150 [Phyllobacterium sp. 22229]|uniref:hypothetical protein n=1 Tax=Phyllobacterium sp. 22229 TaxID=3453895 RepID=UPI003F82EA53
MTITDTDFQSLVDARCWNIRPTGFHPKAWRDAVAAQILREQDALSWVPADPELIRQCSTDAMLQVAA